MYAESDPRLCLIEQVAEGEASECPGESCAYWQKGCVLDRVEHQLAGRPDVAGLLLAMRRMLEREGPRPATGSV
jgi:hypothetical protein